ncbi:unnamed protein product [Plutella xylostella]|uniref:(diamondback moth) hypothetical protein n=1 Tax=Plutella xylostella TaxID=51655 RepID=A0A8S4FY43_PLUXY|nr:unnamed protein product [Plutella xylostella]
MCLDMSLRGPGAAAAAAAAGVGGALWSPLLALHACRLRRYLSDDCAAPRHDDRRRCAVCLAAFPSAWLLERHAALQHAACAPGDDKPFVCEQCGQSYRYRSAYVKHREQNHRARLPADKLFTCDVCGMQFRYLKSFKKHRLNHTLERLHTKTGEEERVTSTDEHRELDLSLRRARSPDDQDSTVDSNGPSDSIVTVDDSTDCRNSSAGEARRRTRRRRAPRVLRLRELHGRQLGGGGRGGGGAGARGRGAAGAAGGDERQRERERRFRVPVLRQVRALQGEPEAARAQAHRRAPFVCLFCGRAFGASRT